MGVKLERVIARSTHRRNHVDFWMSTDDEHLVEDFRRIAAGGIRVPQNPVRDPRRPREVPREGLSKSRHGRRARDAQHCDTAGTGGRQLGHGRSVDAWGQDLGPPGLACGMQDATEPRVDEVRALVEPTGARLRHRAARETTSTAGQVNGHAVKGSERVR